MPLGRRSKKTVPIPTPNANGLHEVKLFGLAYILPVAWDEYGMLQVFTGRDSS